MDDVIEEMLKDGYSSDDQDDWLDITATGIINKNSVELSVFPWHMGQYKVRAEIKNVPESSTVEYFSSRIEAKRYFDKLILKYKLNVIKKEFRDSHLWWK